MLFPPFLGEGQGGVGAQAMTERVANLTLILPYKGRKSRRLADSCETGERL
jgi:hypothetical protein